MFTTAELFGRFHSPKKPLRQAYNQAIGAPPNELERLFGSLLPAGLLSQNDEGINSRNRTFDVRITFWAFLWQMLNPGSSCRCAVLKIIAWFRLLGRPKIQQDDSPFCQARLRLEIDRLERALRASAQAADRRVPEQWSFHGAQVVVGDGTTSSAPDEPKNQAAFPQSARQLPGCGFPLVKWVALFSLSSGAALDVAIGNKHDSELKLFRKIWHHLKAGMIFLADRGFCDYVTLATLWQRHVHSVLRLNQSRSQDLRRGKRLGRYDRLVTWQKPTHKARTATKTLWRRLPKELTLRLIRYPVLIPGFRPRHITLATTLLDPAGYPAAELAALYLRRWRAELFLRDIKITLRMDHLTCKTPAMLRREILMHLIAYNFIRCLMVEAASICDLKPEWISFKGSVDSVRHFSQVIALARNQRQRTQLINDLLAALAGDPLPDRPNRVEPRHRKRRPKAFPVLTMPRAQWKAKRLANKTPNKHGA